MRLGFRTSGGPVGAAERQRCADDNGEALPERKRTMSGSEFERQNISSDAPSAAFSSKPADVAREPMREHTIERHTIEQHTIEQHTWRPAAEGLYDPALEKD